MRDVGQLCKRVLVIAHGKLVYDGALSGITDRFGREKLVKLQFEGTDSPTDLGQFGEVASREGPVVDLKNRANAVSPRTCWRRSSRGTPSSMSAFMIRRWTR